MRTPRYFSLLLSFIFFHFLRARNCSSSRHCASAPLRLVSALRLCASSRLCAFVPPIRLHSQWCVSGSTTADLSDFAVSCWSIRFNNHQELPYILHIGRVCTYMHRRSHGRRVCKAHLGTCLGKKIGELFSRHLEAQQKVKYNVF